MSLIVIHGEKTEASRIKLAEVVANAQSKGQELTRLDAKGLTLAQLESTLNGQSLFEASRLFTIEGLFSLPLSKARTQLIEMVADTARTQELVLWDKKSLTKTQLKTLNPSQIFEFKPSPVLFQWLDSVSSAPVSKKRQLQLLHQAVAAESAELCAIMLGRQVRLLIQAKTGSNLKGAPFMIAKYKKQAQSFSLEQLLKLHTSLLNLDLKLKTGQSAWNLAGELDILTLKL